jgi:hypothetical protein
MKRSVECVDFFSIEDIDSLKSLMAQGWMIFKAKIVQDCKKSKVEMYKSIWGLVFKCNDNGR